jgi:hypothetical protein
MVRRVAEGLRMPWCYSHVGVELALDHKRSPVLKDTLDPGCSHNLEAHLHLLDGYVFFARRHPQIDNFDIFSHLVVTSVPTNGDVAPVAKCFVET